MSHLETPINATAESGKPLKVTTGSLFIIFLTVFIDLLGFAMVIPLLPIYAKQFQTDESGLLVGMLMASFSAMQFLFAPFWGRFSDRIGRRPILLVGLAGAAIFYTLFGIATMQQSILLLFISRIGAGIACATIPVAQAYIADCTSLENRGKGMALIGVAFGIGFSFGPLLGACALWMSPTSEAIHTSPWPGYAAGILSALAWLIALLKLPESLHKESQSAAKKIFDFGAWGDAFRTPSVPGLLLASFVSILSFGGFETTLSLLLKDDKAGYSFTLPHVLLYFSYIGVVLTLVQGGIVRRLSGKVSDGKIASMGAIASLFGLLLLTFAVSQRSFTWLVLASAVEVTGFAFMSPTLQALLSRRSDPTKQGSIAGVGQSVSALARIAGPLFAIPLFTRHAMLPYVAAAGMMLIGFVVLQDALRRGKDYGNKIAE